MKTNWATRRLVLWVGMLVVCYVSLKIFLATTSKFYLWIAGALPILWLLLGWIPLELWNNKSKK